MCTEPSEQKLSAVFVGVSSWGFGGTNARDRSKTAPSGPNSGSTDLPRSTCTATEAWTRQGGLLLGKLQSLTRAVARRSAFRQNQPHRS